MNLDFLTYLQWIFYVILGLAVLMGFLRGMKKTIFTLITMVIFYVVFFVTVEPVSKLLWTMDMPWLGSILGEIDPALSNFTNFEASIATILELALGESVDVAALSEEMLALVAGLGQFALKIVYTILYFTVILVVYKLICWILGLIILGKSDKGESKNRGFGALFGVLNGIVAIFIMLVMMGGMMSVAESAIALIPEDTNDTTPIDFHQRFTIYEASNPIILLEEPLDSEVAAMIDDLYAMVDAYNANLFVQLAGKIQAPSIVNETETVPLHINLFDRVLSFDFQEEKVAIRYELSVFSAVADIFLESEYATTNEITDITGEEIRLMFAGLGNSSLVVAAMPVVIEFAADFYEQDLPLTKAELYAIDYQTELPKIGEIAGALFDILNGAGVISGEGGTEDIVIDGDFVRDLFQDMSDSTIIVALVEGILVPMIETGEEGVSNLIRFPDGLDWEAEITAIGLVLGEIFDADLTFADLAEGDSSVFLSAAAEIDLDVLLGSGLITETLIHILSGDAGVEGLEMLAIPDGITWIDEDKNGELRNILVALESLLDVVTDLDFDNLGLDTLADLDDATIDNLFGSYVFVATISDLILEQDLGDTPIVVPDGVFDSQGYIEADEMKALVKAITMIVSETVDGTEFNVSDALSMTTTEIDRFLDSEIIAATVGKMIVDLNISLLELPQDIINQVAVDGMNTDVVSTTEIAALLEALAILELADFDSLAFDATIIDRFELSTNPAVLDSVKIDTFLSSKIIHASISAMIFDLDDLDSSLVTIPSQTLDGVDLVSTVALTDYLLKTEIAALFEAIHAIEILSFDEIDLENTDLLIDKLDVLLDSAIFHATVSDQVLGIPSTVITIPEQDASGNSILTLVAETTYIDGTELENLFAVLDHLAFDDPTAFTNDFSLSLLVGDSNQDLLLSSAIMHATISEKILSLGDEILLVPNVSEDNLIDIRFETGPVGLKTEFIAQSEIKALINAFIAMEFLNLDSFGTEIASSKFFDHADAILLSSALQATLSDKILNGTGDGNIIVPDADSLANDIRIQYPDVEYISVAELEKIIDALKLLSLTNLSSAFTISPANVFQVSDYNLLVESATMQATISKYVLQGAADETALPGTTALIVPLALRESVNVESVATPQVVKAELVHLLEALEVLEITDFDGQVSASTVASFTTDDGDGVDELDVLLTSGSLHVTVDNMLQDNAIVYSKVPDLAKETILYGVANLTKKLQLITFIKAADILSGSTSDFTNVTFNLTTITSLSEADRNEVLDSMIVRNSITDELETFMLADDPLDMYWPANSDYEINDPLTFLTEAGINAVLTHYGLI